MFTTRPEIVGTFGVVTSTHWLATAAGMSMLEKGGNAFDAAVATGVSLNILEPDQNGPGGDVPIIVYNAKADEVKVICGQGTAPAAASVEAYKAMGLDVVPGRGHLPAVVPGSFGAWMLMLAEYGTMSLREVLEPAMGYARDGIPMLPRISRTIAENVDFFTKEWPTSAKQWLPSGAAPPVRSQFPLPDTFATYERLVAEAEAAGGSRENQIEGARKSWYEGFVAEAIDDFLRTTPVMDESGTAHTGLLTGQDMANWRATIEDPITYDYLNYTVCKAGPWCQGPVFLQQLALLKGFDLTAMGPESPDFVHTVIECAKLAFADREAFYGDPDFVDVPFDVLLSDEYNDMRRDLIDDKASSELRPGSVQGYGGKVFFRPQGTIAKAGIPATAAAGAVGGDTCHFDIIDNQGNMVAATPSGGWLDGSPTVPGLGISVSARGQMFWLDDDTAASLEPGKRPRTTLTPSMALRDGKPYMAFGTPGGDMQDTWSLHAFLRHVHFDMNLQEAIESPQFHTEHMPNSFYPRESKPAHLALEGRFAKETIAELQARGHEIDMRGDWTISYVTAATQDDDGVLRAGASPRNMQCYAAGR
jgi:gamma-glutamyltranspeptidase / glutathione hydrolase